MHAFTHRHGRRVHTHPLGCAEALAGRAQAALAHLAAAIEGDPARHERAAADPDLDALRDHPDFPGRA